MVNIYNVSDSARTKRFSIWVTGNLIQGLLNTKMLSYWCRDSQFKHKTFWRPSYLHNGDPHTSKDHYFKARPRFIALMYFIQTHMIWNLSRMSCWHNTHKRSSSSLFYTDRFLKTCSRASHLNCANGDLLCLSKKWHNTYGLGSSVIL